MDAKIEISYYRQKIRGLEGDVQIGSFDALKYNVAYPYRDDSQAKKAYK